ncbi:DUF2815 family protein [Terrisporobacter sp.]
MSKEDKTKVVTNVVRLSYANVWESRLIGGVEKYSVSIIIDKDDKDTLEKIEKAVNTAIEDGIKKFGKVMMDESNLKLPLREGNDMGEDAYKDKYFLNASSIIPPEIVDKDVKPILIHDEVYSGVFARVSVRFYPYNKNNNTGVGCGLLNIQKIADGERLCGSRSTAKEDFQVVEDDFLS